MKAYKPNQNGASNYCAPMKRLFKTTAFWGCSRPSLSKKRKKDYISRERRSWQKHRPWHKINNWFALAKIGRDLTIQIFCLTIDMAKCTWYIRTSHESQILIFPESLRYFVKVKTQSDIYKAIIALRVNTLIYNIPYKLYTSHFFYTKRSQNSKHCHTIPVGSRVKLPYLCWL